MNDFLHFKLIHIGSFHITILHLVKVLLVIIVSVGFMKILGVILNRQVNRKRIDSGQSYAIRQIIKYLLYVIAAVIILDVFGVHITILLAGSAALLVGIGLGIQHVFNDLISGIILLVEGSVKVRDVVETENRIGKVLKIGLRTSTLLTREDVSIIVPNSLLVSREVINWSHNRQPTRFSVSVPIPYGTQPGLISEILLQVVHQHPKTEREPAPTVRLVNFGESGLQYELLFYSYHMFGIEKIKSDLRIDIYKMLMERNIHIPFPQRDVHLRKDA